MKGSISNLPLIFQQNEQTLQGSFSSVSTPNFARKIRWKALDEIYKIYMLLHRSEREAKSRVIEKKPPKAAINLGTDVDAPWGEKIETSRKDNHQIA